MAAATTAETAAMRRMVRPNWNMCTSLCRGRYPVGSAVEGGRDTAVTRCGTAWQEPASGRDSVRQCPDSYPGPMADGPTVADELVLAGEFPAADREQWLAAVAARARPHGSASRPTPPSSGCGRRRTTASRSSRCTRRTTPRSPSDRPSSATARAGTCASSSTRRPARDVPSASSSGAPRRSCSTSPDSPPSTPTPSLAPSTACCSTSRRSPCRPAHAGRRRPTRSLTVLDGVDAQTGRVARRRPGRCGDTRREHRRARRAARRRRRRGTGGSERTARRCASSPSTAPASTTPARRTARSSAARSPPPSSTCARSTPAASTPPTAIGRIELRLAATADQFATIAKFRAVRLLWARVAEVVGAPQAAAATPVHAVTSTAMMTSYDPWVNTLRSTVACFAAGVAGADAVTVLPHDHLQRGRGHRARSTHRPQHAVDPAARVAPRRGHRSGRRLVVRRALHRRARRRGVGVVPGDRSRRWPRGRGVERRWSPSGWRRPATPAGATSTRGGPRSPGSPSSRTSTSRRRPGDDRYPLRWAAEIEALRRRVDRVAAETGRRPAVFLATIGTPATFTPRVTFAKNFFEVGGLGTVQGPVTDDAAEIAAAFAATGATVACLCSSDAGLRRARWRGRPRRSTPPAPRRCSSPASRRPASTGRSTWASTCGPP